MLLTVNIAATASSSFRGASIGTTVLFLPGEFVRGPQLLAGQRCSRYYDSRYSWFQSYKVLSSGASDCEHNSEGGLSACVSLLKAATVQ